MPIIYDAPNNIITVTGYTEGSPCTLEDIYQADVAGGWGVVSKQGSRQYLFECFLQIGDGSASTYFADDSKEVEIASSVFTGWWQTWCTVKNNAHFRFGILIDLTAHITKQGVDVILQTAQGGSNIIYSDSTGSEIFIYSSHWNNLGSSYPICLQSKGTTRLYHVVFDRGYVAGTGGTDNFDIYDLVLENLLNYGLLNVDGTIDEVYSHSSTYAVGWQYLYSENAPVKNIIAKSNTYAVFAQSISVDHYVINGDIDTWNFYWYGTNTAKVYRQYEFVAHCQDKDGNDLSGVSAVGEYISPYGQAFSVTTDANGDISTQIVDHGWFEQTTGNTENLKTPLKVTYAKPGYQTVVKYYSMDKKTDDVIVMHKAVSVFLDFGRPIINLKKSNPENKNVMGL